MQLSTNKFKIWWDTTRWVAFPQSAMPVLLGGLLAFTHDKFNWLYFIIVFLGILIVHAGTNMMDDYADLRMCGDTIRKKLQSEGKDPVRIAKAPYVMNGNITLAQLLSASLILFALGIVICIYLTIQSGWPVIAIATAGALICFFYSMPPLKLSYRGLGELVVSLSMGPGICLGTYYAVSGAFSWEPVLISLPIGLLIGQVLFIHSVMDYRPDTAVNKKTLVAILGGQSRAIDMIPCLMAAIYGSIILGIVLHILPLTTLLVLLTLPMAISFMQTGQKLKRGQYDGIAAKWWMGPMEQMLAGHEWFLITWKQARNLLIFITLLIFVAYAIELIFQIGY